MTIAQAFEIVDSFSEHADTLVIGAIDYLCQLRHDKKLTDEQCNHHTDALVEIKWGYSGISIIAGEVPKYLTTHPGFLADVIMWAGWQFVLDERAKVNAR